MNFRKKLLSLVLVVALLFTTFIISVNASTTYGCDGFKLQYYDISDYDQEFMITGYTGDKTDISTPVMYNSTYISKIASFAFLKNTQITSISINDYINIIEKNAFEDADNLKEVFIADSVKTIEENAFLDCNSLVKVTINKGTESISDSAFTNSENVVIYCYKDSYAESYAKTNNISYVLLDDPQPSTEPVTQIETVTQPVTEPVKETFIVGDVNDDKSVTITDATMIQQVIAKLIPLDDRMEQRGDTSFEGSMSISDVTRIQQYLASIEVDVNHVGETREYK